MNKRDDGFDGGGTFLGQVVTAWRGHRDMVLLEPFAYRDSRDKTWSAPAGAVINGASIPKVFWTLFGSPYVGRYRDAAVIHDYYCAKRIGCWKEAHWMFFDACIAGGVPRWRARLMYWAVYWFGKTWRKPGAIEAMLQRFKAAVFERRILRDGVPRSWEDESPAT